MSLIDWEQRVIKRVDACKDELVKLCSNLVRIPSYDRETRGEAESAHLVGRHLEQYKIPYELFKSHPSIENLVAALEGVKEGRRLLFNGHIDVVPPGSLDDWTVDPFGGEVKEGRVYGRGSVDMKGGVAAMTVALCVLKNLDVPLKGTVIINVVGDEERQGDLGTTWCINNIWEKIRADASIVSEPTGTGTMGRTLCIGEKGPIWVKVTTKGRKAHGSVPLMGENAITRMLRFLAALLDQELPTVPPPLEREVLIQQIAGVMGMESAALESLLAKNGRLNFLHAVLEALTKTTLNVGTISGGVVANVVPDQCEVELDFRILPGQSPQTIPAFLHELARDLGLANAFEVEIISAFEGTSVPNFEADSLATTLLTTSRELAGPTIFFMATFATDGRLLRKAGISSTVVYGPGNGALAHQADEYISIEEMITATKVNALTAMRYLGIDE
ncbi:MAG: M20 family metallopeptidase [Promethearchaeota archaeon]